MPLGGLNNASQGLSPQLYPLGILRCASPSMRPYSHGHNKAAASLGIFGNAVSLTNQRVELSDFHYASQVLLR